MNSKIYKTIALIFSLQLVWMGCAQKANKTIASNKTQNKSKAALSNSSKDDSTGPYDEILGNDIFTPPDMRRIAEAPPPSADTTPEIIEPQKLTITGIVYDGIQYMVSVENQETGDIFFLKTGDSLAQYPIVTIDFDTVKVQDKKKLVAYGIGDQIPLPGTRSMASNVSPISEDSTLAKDTTGGKENEILSATSATTPSSTDSMEEILRKRRLKEEEDLK